MKYNPVAESILIGAVISYPVNHPGIVPDTVVPAATAQLELGYPHVGVCFVESW